MLLFHVLDAPYLITATDFHAYDFSINRLQLFEDLMTNQIFKETFFSDKGNKLSHSIKLLVVFQPLLLDETQTAPKTISSKTATGSSSISVSKSEKPIFISTTRNLSPHTCFT